MARAARLEAFLGEHGGVIPLGILRTVVPAAPDAWILRSSATAP
jgi:gamma-glutamyltranspeptidase/glutathione hydrolase